MKLAATWSLVSVEVGSGVGVFVGKGVWDGVNIGKIGVAVGCGVFIAVGGCVAVALFVTVEVAVGRQLTNIKIPMMSKE